MALVDSIQVVGYDLLEVGHRTHGVVIVEQLGLLEVEGLILDRVTLLETLELVEHVLYALEVALLHVEDLLELGTQLLVPVIVVSVVCAHHLTALQNAHCLHQFAALFLQLGLEKLIIVAVGQVRLVVLQPAHLGFRVLLLLVILAEPRE